MKTERADVVLSPAGKAVIGSLVVWKMSDGGLTVTEGPESPGPGATLLGPLEEKDYVFAIETKLRKQKRQ